MTWGQKWPTTIALGAPGVASFGSCPKPAHAPPFPGKTGRPASSPAAVPAARPDTERSVEERRDVLTVGSLFSGVGGMDKGLEDAGMKVIWQCEIDKQARAVLVGAQDKLLHAVDLKTGRGIWTFATKARVDGSPVVVGRRVFVGSADGWLYAVQLKTGNELWKFEAGGHIVGSPAVAAGRLVIGTDAGDLYCFGAK